MYVPAHFTEHCGMSSEEAVELSLIAWREQQAANEAAGFDTQLAALREAIGDTAVA